MSFLHCDSINGQVIRMADERNMSMAKSEKDMGA
jgi:hypothetical protein